jgi:hypothetical protein
VYAAKFTVVNSEVVSALLLLIFVEEAPSFARESPGSWAMCQFARDVGPRDGCLFWENIVPLWACESCL